MSLMDDTSRTIPLSLEKAYDDDYAEVPVTLSVVDAFNSSLTPSNWVWLAFDDASGNPWFKLTYEEAGLLHDRLGLILGRSGTEAGK